jgi:hypothetical protein
LKEERYVTVRARRAMQASPFRLWPTLKRANMRAKARTSVRARGGCKTSDAGCKGKNSCKGKVGCATDGTKPLNFSNQAIAARLSEQLGPLCGVGVSTLRLTQKLKLLALPTDQASGAKR